MSAGGGAIHAKGPGGFPARPRVRSANPYFVVVLWLEPSGAVVVV
jgi:hypothetical protein